MNNKLVSVFIILCGVSAIIFRRQLSILQMKILMWFRKINPLKRFDLSNKVPSSDLEKIGIAYYSIVGVIVGIFFILMGVLGLLRIVIFLNN